jgi:hypothetical protein
MPRYTVKVHEYSTYIVQFDADSLEHAMELVDDAMDTDDLPESEKFWKNGSTDWDTPTEVVGRGVVDLSALTATDYEDDEEDI